MDDAAFELYVNVSEQLERVAAAVPLLNAYLGAAKLLLCVIAHTPQIYERKRKVALPTFACALLYAVTPAHIDQRLISSACKNTSQSAISKCWRRFIAIPDVWIMRDDLIDACRVSRI